MNQADIERGKQLLSITANPVALKATFSRNTAVEKKATTLAAAILERTGMIEWFYLTLEIGSRILRTVMH